VRRSDRGMTMMEALLVVGFMSMIGLATYQALSNGLKVWDFSQRLGAEREIMISLDKMTIDLKNSFAFSGMEFKGTEQRLSFPTIVYGLQDRRRRQAESEYTDQIGYVEYAFDAMGSTFTRRPANYSQALKERFGKPQTLITDLRGLKFRYYYQQEQKLDFFSTTDLGRPLAVEVTFEFEDRSGQRQQMKRFIYLPVRG
jgi:hypothetical protein